jgi:hypothetical protein
MIRRAAPFHFRARSAGPMCPISLSDAQLQGVPEFYAVYLPYAAADLGKLQ